MSIFGKKPKRERPFVTTVDGAKLYDGERGGFWRRETNRRGVEYPFVWGRELDMDKFDPGDRWFSTYKAAMQGAIETFGGLPAELTADGVPIREGMVVYETRWQHFMEGYAFAFFTVRGSEWDWWNMRYETYYATQDAAVCVYIQRTGHPMPSSGIHTLEGTYDRYMAKMPGPSDVGNQCVTVLSAPWQPPKETT